MQACNATAPELAAGVDAGACAGTHRVKLAHARRARDLRVGVCERLAVRVHGPPGGEPRLVAYMGAAAHVTAVPLDRPGVLLHAHGTPPGGPDDDCTAASDPSWRRRGVCLPDVVCLPDGRGNPRPVESCGHGHGGTAGRNEGWSNRCTGRRVCGRSRWGRLCLGVPDECVAAEAAVVHREDRDCTQGVEWQETDCYETRGEEGTLVYKPKSASETPLVLAAGWTLQ